MATFDTASQLLGTPLEALLKADCIRQGHGPSYQLCKVIYEYHPHGAKIVDFPVQMAMHKPREITVPKSPNDGEELVAAFKNEWKSLLIDNHIANVARQARMYGVCSVGLLEKDVDPSEPVDFKGLADATIGINTFDPLNTAGSLVLNQDPNALDFQKVPGVVVNGKPYDRTRTVTLMNEDPLYISYVGSGYGFLGRSVYQRALVALKSFLYTLDTDAMVALKAGVLVNKRKSPSSAIDGPMSFIFGIQRNLVKEAQTGNVITIDVTEDVESINLQNLEAPYALARKNIIENEAAGSGTPAKIVLAETYAEGFAEGTEDAKAIAQFVDGIRTWLGPLYTFFDEIVMYRAWNQAFFERMKKLYPDAYKGVEYNTFFQEVRNSFTAQWPNLLQEPESERMKGEDVVLKAIIAVVEVLLPILDPANKSKAAEWMADNLNERKLLFSSPLVLDYEALANYEPPAAAGFGAEGGAKEPAEPPPESSRDSARTDAIDSAVRLVAELAQKHGVTPLLQVA